MGARRPARTDFRGRERPQPGTPSRIGRSPTGRRLRKCHWPSYPDLDFYVANGAVLVPVCGGPTDDPLLPGDGRFATIWAEDLG